jgi:eukaryotic-like serine/threonine-protein kinase
MSDPFGAELQARLRRNLDEVKPPYSSPRYLSASARPLAWRLAPAALAVSLVGMLAVSAFFATGSANPAVWGEKVVTIIESSSTTPSPQPSPTTDGQPPVAGPSHEPEHESPEPSDAADPTEPEEHESPQPSPSPESSGSSDSGDGHSGEGSPDDSGGDSHEGSSDSEEVQRS